MKRFPLLLLALMAALFLATLNRPEAWAGWLQAFAEAGMVGALADWFAVVALFRHPLGLPIPHTAIIPRRKNEIGDNLARFVAEHFLHPDVVRNKLESVNLARNGALWLKSPRGRERMQELGVGATRWVLGALHEARVRQFIGRPGSRELARFELAPLLGRALDWLIEDGRHQGVLTQSLRFALVALHDNRETIRENVKRGSPWWLPGFVDDRILVQMLDRIETLLLELSLDPDHRLRGNFNDWVGQWAHNLQHSSEYRRWGEGLKQDLLENERLQDYLYRLWVDMVTGLESDLADPESRFSAELGRLTGGLAEELETDPAIQEWVNRWLVALAVTAVDENRLAIASLINDTVRSWTPSKPRRASNRPSAATCNSSGSMAPWSAGWWGWSFTRRKYCRTERCSGIMRSRTAFGPTGVRSGSRGGSCARARDPRPCRSSQCTRPAANTARRRPRCRC
jgi:uncharacterized membrane-anchored protein YjiN (DUF445 family)